MEGALTPINQDFAPRPKPKTFSRKIFLFIGIAILIVIAIFLFVNKEKPSPKSVEESETATTSAKIEANSCPQGQEYLNEKQGYQLCFPEGWKSSELKISALTVGFGLTVPTEESPGILSVIVQDKSIDATLQETITGSSKYEFGKAFVDNIAGSQIVYTRGKDDPLKTYPLAIDTLISIFGRTYTLRLNSTESSRSEDEKIYEDFLNSWKFLAEVKDPPWSESRNILVYSPWVGDTVKNPIILSGEAIAFEATLNIRIKDEDDHILLETTVQTQSGAVRSPFSSELTYDKPSTKKGVVEVFTISAADGSEQDKVTIPVQFQ